MPDVSVLMFTYRPKNAKRNHYVIQAIKSLRIQEGIDIQVVILDDGSPTPIKPSLLKNTENVTFEYNYYKQNRGKHKMMDIGLPLMGAEVMTTLHDDDYLYGKHSLLSRFNCFYKQPATALIWTDAIYRRGGSKWKRSSRIKTPSPHTHAALLKRNYICGATYLIQTNLKQRFRAHRSLKHAEEYDIWLQVSKYAATNGLSLRYCPVVTGVYRLHNEQNWEKVRRFSAAKRGALYENEIRRRNA